MYPRIRMRRRRNISWMRDLSSENSVSVKDLIQPLFIIEGKNKIEDFFCDIKKYTIDMALKKISEIISLGIRYIMIFPCVDQTKKTLNGIESINPDNLICRAIRKIKNEFGNSIGIISDVALDPYTISGHDGIYDNGEVVNDKTIEILCKQSLIQASSGSDIIAPSDMMDGRVMCIRDALDNCNMNSIAIMSYAVKYNSSLYDPFRNIIGSKQDKKIDKSTYQLQYNNSDEAINEIELDIKEGSDFIVIKPSMFYGDIIYRAKNKFNIPIISYQVSGEYVAIKNNNISLAESILSIKRSGADKIITYAAMEIAQNIKLFV